MLNPLAKGFYNFQGVPARIPHDYGWPEIFSGTRWSDLRESEIAKFMHDARRVEQEEFAAHVELRKQQHAEFLELKGQSSKT